MRTKHGLAVDLVESESGARRGSADAASLVLRALRCPGSTLHSSSGTQHFLPAMLTHGSIGKRRV